MKMKNVEDVYPLSPMQQGLLFHSLYSRERGAYVEQIGWTVAGGFNEAAFEHAWRQVIARHAPLRTCFFWEELKQPLQVARQKVELPWQRYDWSGLSPETVSLESGLVRPLRPRAQVPYLNGEAQRQTLQTFLESDRRRDFDLTKAPLMRLSQSRLSADSHQFIWTYHHLILDGWSVSLVLREVFQCYQALCSGIPAEVEQRRPFRDYIAWLQQHDTEQAEAYWRERLRGVVGPTSLTIERTSGAADAGTVNYATQQVQLSAAATERLRMFAREHQLTLSILVEGAWAVLLGRYGDARDVVFGIVVTGRPPTLSGAEAMVGLFINTLPMRVAIPPQADCVQWLKQLQLQQVEMRQYEQPALAQIHEWSNVPRGQQLFQSIVVFDNAAEDQALGAEGTNVEIKNVFRANTVTNYPITLGVVAGPALSLHLTYDQRLFDSSAIARILKQVETLLMGFADGAVQRLCDLPLHSESERHLLLTEWNDTAVRYADETCVAQLIEAQAERSPQAVAVVFEKTYLTYAELNLRANRLAQHLLSLGVGPETLVGICAERSPELVWGVLGILKAGGAYVPLDPAFPPDRLAFMIEDSGIGVLLTQKRLVADLPAHDAKVVIIDEDSGATSSANEPFSCDVSIENLAYVIYTSGSTGQPKGVQIEHRALTNFLQSFRRDLTADDVLLSVTTLSFDIAALELFLPLIAGARLVLASRETAADGLQLQRLLAESAATVMQATPSTWRMLMDAGWAGDPRLKILCGGEQLSRELANQLLTRSGSLLNLYGPTETTIWSSLHRIELGDGPVAIGRPMANSLMFILDRNLSPTPVGATGELYIGGDGLARGYLRRTELTADKFIPHPFGVQPGQRLYRTGDIARYLPDGNIECLGRVDEQVKVRGFRIELGEIESVINQHPSVQQSVVVAREDSPGDKRLVAYIVAANGNESNTTALRAHLKGKLPDYMLPAAFVTLNELPLTPNGKINRRALPAPGSARPELEEAFVSPRTPPEEALVAIWKEVLGIEDVGINDNFFELGGDSIMSIQVVSKAKRAGLNIVPKDLFEHQTIALLAAAAAPVIVADAEQGVVKGPAPDSADFRPSDFPLASLKQQHIDELTAHGRPIEDIYALSPMQEGMLFHAMQSPESGIYCEQIRVSLQGPLDVSAFERAWQGAVACHSILRTAFVWKHLDEPVQIVYRHVGVALEKQDWRGLARTARSERLERFRRLDLKREFDLSEAPLMRMTLFQLEEQAFELVWTYHHILLDGWSVPLFLKEVLERYEELRQGRQSRRETSQSFRSYIAWLKQQDLREAEGFWRERLRGFTGPTPLIGSAGPRTVHGERDDYDHQEIVLSPTLVNSLRALTREHHLTLNTLSQGSWALLLSRYSGESDVVFGATVSGRPTELPGSDTMIGLFINTLPVRVHIGDESVLTWLKGLQAQQVEVSQFVYSPLAQLQGWSDVPRGMPLFESLLVFENYPVDASLEQMPEDLEIRSTRKLGRTDYALTLVVVPGEELVVKLLYDCRRFRRTTITRMLAHLQNLLAAMATDVNQSLARLSLISEAEEHATLVEWNDTQADYPVGKCFHWLVENEVMKAANTLAVSFDGQRLTYGDLNARANQLAHYLRRFDVGPEVRVGICVGRSAELVVARLGVLKAGGAYVSLDPDHPPARLAFMLEDAQAPVLITEQRFVDRLAGVPATVVSMDRDWGVISQESMDNPHVRMSAGNLAYVYFTSGSTGKPKGVEIDHAGLVNLVTWHNHAYLVTPNDRKSQLSGLAFDASVWELWPYLVAGASVHIPNEETRASWPKLLKWMVAEAITICFLPTPLAEAVMDDEWPPDIALRALLTGGDRLHRWPQKSLPFSFVNKYGPTEVSAVTTWAPMTGATLPDLSPPIGRPMANTETFILDSNLQPVPVGVTGELYIGGIGLARGYLNQADLTAEKFIPHPFSNEPGARLYSSGDLACYQPDGNIEFIGRSDSQVKIRGYRIELGEIEKSLAEHPAIREAVVLVSEDLSGVKQLAAYFVPTHEHATMAGELREFLKERLPAYMVPSIFVSLNSLPLTPNGKLDRRAMRPIQRSESEPPHAYVAPQSPLEAMLAEIWAQVMGLERVGIHDNFFELGGDSILSIRIIARAGQKGIELSPDELFLHPTISELAQKCVPAANIQASAENATERLRAATDLSSTVKTEGLTLADFPNADLSQSELNDLLAHFNEAKRAD